MSGLRHWRISRRRALLTLLLSSSAIAAPRLRANAQDTNAKALAVEEPDRMLTSSAADILTDASGTVLTW